MELQQSTPAVEEEHNISLKDSSKKSIRNPFTPLLLQEKTQLILHKQYRGENFFSLKNPWTNRLAVPGKKMTLSYFLYRFLELYFEHIFHEIRLIYIFGVFHFLSLRARRSQAVPSKLNFSKIFNQTIKRNFKALS